MRESQFVKRNTDKWQAIEQNPSRNPDELTERFVELTDDLSYARTFYPDSNVTRYLNGLTAQMHRGLMQNRRDDRSRFITFWQYELPLLFRQSQRLLAVSAGIFLIACVLGWVSAAHDNTFVRLILGDQYVNMTLENIRKGDPLGVYNSSDQATMFVQITLNNIYVAFRTFIFGLFASFGTIAMLFYNGVMLGSFQYFFYERGLLLDSVLKIWVHGTLEISAIVIAGCAGLTVGNSLLFPGTFSRLDSFKRGIRQGLKIAVGLVPIFIAAGFLESFITRLTLPPLVSGSIILISAAFIIWYFIIYPIHLNRKVQP
ncbi:stage II sporulation protein M [Spirosoma utsteinense]|uniref:Membrane protein SpoIIM required for sporulation n=1 Tax=Spirosoma utsteinense TaxID=2585773 RepID=A0ABR6W7B0_9BACT|nr:stage II sporulation protein M [Spirosoma utsteinense]MBC3784905.1 putative membrane protein SpoIIM required for sporulation [Spirosoma utsteinense]MBC3792466.1 putative membrane protein SpoIIM required for sporulation [Spirosoma utsteinense]